MAIWNTSQSVLTITFGLVIAFFYIGRPRLRIRMNTYFTILLITEFATILSDYWASEMLNRKEMFPIWSLYFINTVYFIAFIGRSYAFFVYVTTIFNRDIRINRWTTTVSYMVFLVAEIMSVSSFNTGYVFSIDSEGAFVGGPFYNIFYLLLIFYLVLGLYYSTIRRDMVQKHEYLAVVAAHIILLIGTGVRVLFPHLLILDSFFIVSMLIVFLVFENSDIYLEQRTRAFNYQAFEKVIDERVRYGENFWIMAVMLRNYTEVREVYGGSRIDATLKHMADYLRDKFRHEDIFYARNGCYIVVFNNDSRREAIRDMVKEAFSRTWLVEGREVSMEPVYAEMSSDLKVESAELLSEAIRRLIDNASSGRANDIKDLDDIDDEFTVIDINQRMLDDAAHDSEVKKALNRALDKDDIKVYLQPIIDASSGKLIAAEALARIDDPKLGLIPPGYFIPIAEKTGTISQMGEQVFKKVCRFIKDHPDIGLEFVNVNLSPIQCMDKNLSARFEEIIKEFDIKPDSIHLEITEESLVDTKVLEWQMNLLIEKGFSFALDDYGSGYSNQFRLKQFPFVGVKLDMSIVWAHFAAPDALLPNTVKAFIESGLSVTAEGVENKEIADGLIGMGCTYLQGYYYAKPLPINEFLKLCAA